MSRSSITNEKALRLNRIGRRLVYLAICALFCAFTLGPLLKRAQVSEGRRPSGSLAAKPAAVAFPAVQSPTIPPPVKEYIYAGDRLLATKQPIQFTDVSPSNPYYQDIATIARLEVTLGCSAAPPMFCPTSIVNREQMAAFIMRAMGNYFPPTPATQRFLDVPPSNVFYAFIDLMAVCGITLGCGGGNYCPAANVTHGQMAAFMSRAVNLGNPQQPPSQYFCDVAPSNGFYAFIHSYSVDRQVWPGCDCAQTTESACLPGQQQAPAKPCFCPEMNVTREQMARILVRNFNFGP